ncbi:hypothetical protein T552_01674 [Pneumocystis carinii B80]|uniref:Uncharacterized protein n=1 Tax=Pneumocystis carinii (strain B80) TaxID=1408658 RepID=A0A0W4ZJ73_PNEC8|nr:hypothetical protein T552_01674 [Pneumocystis carinii B80]KTW28412.1 hypothetical protein T552_01674 [Pneumocystis carinii B80]
MVFFFLRKNNNFYINKRGIKIQNVRKNTVYSGIERQLALYPCINMDVIIHGLKDFSNAMDSLLPDKKFKIVRKLQRLYEKSDKNIIITCKMPKKMKYEYSFEKKNACFLLSQMAKYFEPFDEKKILGFLTFSIYSRNVIEILIRYYLYKIYFLNKRKQGLMFLQNFLQTLVNSDLKKRLKGISAIIIMKLEVRYSYENPEIMFAMMFAKESCSIDIYNIVKIYLLKICCIQGNLKKAIHILGEMVKNCQIPPFSVMNHVLRMALKKTSLNKNIKERESYLMFFYNKIFFNLYPNYETIKILANYSLTYYEFDKLWSFIIMHPHKNQIIQQCQIEIALAFLRLGRKYKFHSDLNVRLSANTMNFFQYLTQNIAKLHKNTIICLILCFSLFDNFVGLKKCFEILTQNCWKLSEKHYSALYRQTFELNFGNIKTYRYDFIKSLWNQSQYEALSLEKINDNKHSIIEYVRCMGSFNDVQEIYHILEKKRTFVEKGTIIGFMEAFMVANAHLESLLLLKSLSDFKIVIDLDIVKCLFNNIRTINVWNDVLRVIPIELARNRLIVPHDFFAKSWRKVMNKQYSKKSIISKDYVVFIMYLIEIYTEELNKIIKGLKNHRDVEIALEKFEIMNHL